jgi:hypothetical protein
MMTENLTLFDSPAVATAAEVSTPWPNPTGPWSPENVAAARLLLGLEADGIVKLVRP